MTSVLAGEASCHLVLAAKLKDACFDRDTNSVRFGGVSLPFPQDETMIKELPAKLLGIV